MLNTLERQEARLNTPPWPPKMRPTASSYNQPSPHSVRDWVDVRPGTRMPLEAYLQTTSEAHTASLDEAALGEEISRRLAEIYAERLESKLKIGVWATFKILFATLLASHARRGFSLHASQTTGHIAVRLLCAELNMSPTTAYDHLNKLKAAGLLDFRSFKIAAPADWIEPKAGNPESSKPPQEPLKQPVLNTGTLMAIRLLPGFLKPVRLRREDFEATPRNLHSDLQTGNTVANYTTHLTSEQKASNKARRARWKETGHIHLPQEWSVDIKVLVDFTLPADWLGKAPLFISVQFSRQPSQGSSLRGKLEPQDMFSLPEMTAAAAREWIDAIGLSVQEYLGDTKGETVWHDVLWRLYRHAKLGNKNRFQYFFDQLSRAKSEFTQRERHNPSASLIQRLRQKDNGFWHWLQIAPAQSFKVVQPVHPS